MMKGEQDLVLCGTNSGRRTDKMVPLFLDVLRSVIWIQTPSLPYNKSAKITAREIAERKGSSAAEETLKYTKGGFEIE